MLSDLEQARGRRLIVALCCVNLPSTQIFMGSVLLLFLTSMAMKRVGIMVCLSIPAVFTATIQIPFAHLADRKGKKKLGYMGGLLIAPAFLGLLAAAFAPPEWGRVVAVVCVSLIALGTCLSASGWFALIIPMIPPPIRAAYFARLRVSYHLVGFGGGLVCSALLSWRSSAGVFGGLFIFFFALVVLWLMLYARLPEVEKPDPGLPPLGAALGNVIRFQSYLPFCAYAFLLALFTGGCPILFGMIEKTFLHLSDGTVVLLANMRVLGAMLGFFLGGKMVERFGTKVVFLSCHFAFGLVLFLFFWRDAGGGPVVPILLALEASFGLVWAASSVAFTVEMYALIPTQSKSLSTSVFMTLQGTGIALGGLLPACAIQLGMFKEHWTFVGAVRSDYDAMLLICGTLVVVVAITLGLVPSVSGTAQGPALD